MNLAVFFAIIFVKQPTPTIIWLSILVSGLIFAVGQLPAYIAAGCTSSRRFIYTFVILSLFQSTLFGYLFWQYGCLFARCWLICCSSMLAGGFMILKK